MVWNLSRIVRLYAVSLTLSACASALAQTLAPNSLKGLAINETVTGGNNIRVTPNSDFFLSLSGKGKSVYNTSSFAGLDSATDVIGGIGTYAYEVLGDVVTVTQTLTGVPFGANLPALPAAKIVKRYSFLTALSGTFTTTWGNSTNFGSFTLDPSSTLVPLVNISTFIDLSAGQTVTSGFVVGGPIPRKVLIRGIGPALTPFGVGNAIPSTTIAVYSNSKVIASNTGWSGGSNNPAELQTTFNSVGAFPLTVGSKDSAVVLTLAPGSYSASVGAAAAADKGTVLLEVYFVP